MRREESTDQNATKGRGTSEHLIGCIIAALKSGRPGEVYNAVDD